MKRIATQVALFMMLLGVIHPLRVLGDYGDQRKSGEQLYAEKCTPCHSQKRVKRRKKSRERWEKTVKRMQAKVPDQISAEEAQAIVDYLTEHFGSGD